MPRFIMVCGPSCVGKTPLRRALRRVDPPVAARLTTLVLYTSRMRRPTEREGVEYYFRSRREIEALTGQPGFVPIRVRNDLQAVDLHELRRLFATGREVFWEGNPAIIDALEETGALSGIDTLKVFVSPLSKGEVIDRLRRAGPEALRRFVTELMLGKLIRRAERQEGAVSADDRRDLEVRAGTAYDELRRAWEFDAVIPNHDGEDSDHWDASPQPVGDAFRATQALAALIRGRRLPWVETWERELIP